MCARVIRMTTIQTDACCGIKITTHNVCVRRSHLAMCVLGVRIVVSGQLRTRPGWAWPTGVGVAVRVRARRSRIPRLAGLHRLHWLTIMIDVDASRAHVRTRNGGVAEKRLCFQIRSRSLAGGCRQRGGRGGRRGRRRAGGGAGGRLHSCRRGAGADDAGLEHAPWQRGVAAAALAEVRGAELVGGGARRAYVADRVFQPLRRKRHLPGRSDQVAAQSAIAIVDDDDTRTGFSMLRGGKAAAREARARSSHTGEWPREWPGLACAS